MLAPVPDAQFHEEAGDLQPVSGRPVPLLSFSQLSFDTPDEHLPCLLGRFDDRRLVSQGIQRRHMLFLRSAAQSAEAGVLLQGEAADSDLTSYQPQDFRLCEDSEPKRVGDALYYSLRCHKLPGRVLGLRVTLRPLEPLRLYKMFCVMMHEVQMSCCALQSRCNTKRPAVQTRSLS